MAYTQNQKSTGLDTLDETTAAVGDLVIVGDVSDSGRGKGMTWTSVRAWLKAYFDTTYPAGSGTSTGTNTGDETTTTAGALINGATSKTTPVDADYVGLMDSAASNVLKKLSWANLKATLKTYFDTLYATSFTTTSGVANSPTTSQTDTITHGLGRTPLIIRIYSMGAGFLANAAALPATVSIGTYNSTGNRCLYQPYDTAGVTTAEPAATSTSYAVNIQTSSNSFVTGVIQNVGPVTFDIVWTETGTASAQPYLWEAQ